MDVNKLSLTELEELNKKAVARIKVLRRRASEDIVAQLVVGARVKTKPGVKLLEGVITKLNTSTVTVREDVTGKLWRVPANMLEAA